MGGGAGVGGLTSGGGHGGKQRSMLLNGPACPDILARSLRSIWYRQWHQTNSTRTSIGAVLVLTMVLRPSLRAWHEPAHWFWLHLLHVIVAYKETIPAWTGLRRMIPRGVHRGRHPWPRPLILSMRPNHPAAGYSTQGARSTPHPEAGSTSLEYGPAAEFERGNGIDLASIARCRS